MNYTIITIIESIYLFYMYFLFKTKYNISTAILDKAVNKLGPFFAHKSQCYCNKVCGFGKVMAIISIILGFVRLNYLNNPIIIIITEIIIILSLYQKNKKCPNKKGQIKR